MALRLDPKLAIEFDEFDSNCQETWPKGVEELAFRKFRVRIKNLSSAEIRNCSVQLESMIDGKEIKSKNEGVCFKQRHDSIEGNPHLGRKTSFDIRPYDKEYIDIVCMDETDSNSRVLMTYAAPEAPHDIPPNAISRDYMPETLVLKVVATNLESPVLGSYKIWVDNTGRLRVKEV